MRRCLSALALLTLLAAGGCNYLALEEPEPITNLDEAGVRLEKIAGAPLRPYATFDFGRQQNTSARSVLVPEAEASGVLDAIRAELGPGLVAYIGTSTWLGDEKPGSVEVVVMPGDTQFDILRTVHTNPLESELDPDALVSHLRTLDERYGIEIMHAESGAVEFKLHEMPPDLRDFCRELQEQYPATVAPGPGGMESLEEEIVKRHRVLLKWE